MVKKGKAVKFAKRDVSVRTLLTRELYDRLRSVADKDRRTISTTMLLLLEQALDARDSEDD
jgi:hypothetical protein